MNTHQLRCAIECDPAMRKMILGVYASDQIPTNIHKWPTGFIVNTDNSNLPGKHWLAVYMESKNKGEFFDSYGHSSEYFDFDFSNFVYNHKRIQSTTSNVCGQYCLFFSA